MFVHHLLKNQNKTNIYTVPHRHSFFHALYIQGGIGELDIAGERFFCEERDFYIIPPGVEHRIFMIQNFSSLTIKFSTEAMLEKSIQSLGYCVKNLGKYEYMLLKRVFEEATLRKDFYSDFINVWMQELLLSLLRYQNNASDYTATTRKSTMDNYPQQISMAISYIERNITRGISIEELARISNYSVHYFHTIFRREVGVSPIRYIHNRKVEMAKELMFSSDLNITQIAEKLGFESVSYFSRVFKNIAGMTPSVYAERLKGDYWVNFPDGTVVFSEPSNVQTISLRNRIWVDTISNEEIELPDEVSARFFSSDVSTECKNV